MNSGCSSSALKVTLRSNRLCKTLNTKLHIRVKRGIDVKKYSCLDVKEKEGNENKKNQRQKYAQFVQIYWR